MTPSSIMWSLLFFFFWLPLNISGSGFLSGVLVLHGLYRSVGQRRQYGVVGIESGCVHAHVSVCNNFCMKRKIFDLL